MKAMETTLEILTKEYIKKVHEICEFMLLHLDITSKEELCRHGLCNQNGMIEQNGVVSYYFFHGIGCEFKNCRIEIDWDFGYGTYWCGLDPWKVYKYLKYLKSDISLGEIKEGYDKAVREGKMVLKDDRYYFV